MWFIVWIFILFILFVIVPLSISWYSNENKTTSSMCTMQCISEDSTTNLDFKRCLLTCKEIPNNIQIMDDDPLLPDGSLDLR